LYLVQESLKEQVCFDAGAKKILLPMALAVFICSYVSTDNGEKNYY